MIGQMIQIKTTDLNDIQAGNETSKTVKNGKIFGERGGYFNQLKSQYNLPKTISAIYFGTLNYLNSTTFYRTNRS